MNDDNPRHRWTPLGNFSIQAIYTSMDSRTSYAEQSDLATPAPMLFLSIKCRQE